MYKYIKKQKHQRWHPLHATKSNAPLSCYIWESVQVKSNRARHGRNGKCCSKQMNIISIESGNPQSSNFSSQLKTCSWLNFIRGMSFTVTLCFFRGTISSTKLISGDKTWQFNTLGSFCELAQLQRAGSAPSSQLKHIALAQRHRASSMASNWLNFLNKKKNEKIEPATLR